MKTLAIALFLIPTFWMTANAQNLSTADAVLAAYYKALGGKKALLKINDITWKITSLSGQATFPTTIKYKTPLKSLVITSTEKGQVVYKQISDGKTVSIMMGTTKAPLTQAVIDRLVLTNQLLVELYLADKGLKTTFGGKETINGKEAYKLTHTMPDGVTTFSTYYDTQTGLKVQLAVPVQTANPEITQYGDYRAVNGIKLPFLLHVGPNTLKTDSYQLNTGISDDEFVVQ